MEMKGILASTKTVAGTVGLRPYHRVSTVGSKDVGVDEAINLACS